MRAHAVVVSTPGVEHGAGLGQRRKQRLAHRAGCRWSRGCAGFLAYKDELQRAQIAASQGACIALPRVPSNTLRKAPAFRSFPFTAPVAATTRALPTSPISSARLSLHCTFAVRLSGRSDPVRHTERLPSRCSCGTTHRAAGRQGYRRRHSGQRALSGRGEALGLSCQRDLCRIIWRVSARTLSSTRRSESRSAMRFRIRSRPRNDRVVA